jgi:hypothetical protein
VYHFWHHSIKIRPALCNHIWVQLIHSSNPMNVKGGKYLKLLKNIGPLLGLLVKTRLNFSWSFIPSSHFFCPFCVLRPSFRLAGNTGLSGALWALTGQNLPTPAASLALSWARECPHFQKNNNSERGVPDARQIRIVWTWELACQIFLKHSQDRTLTSVRRTIKTYLGDSRAHSPGPKRQPSIR